MDWYTKTDKELLDALAVDPESGLTQEQADERFETYGANVFTEEKKAGLLASILHHLKDTSTIILLIAAAISTYMAITADSGWTKIFVILSIVVVNVVLGISQERSAEKALDALKNMNTLRTTVLRGGSLMHIDAEELVPGDIVELHTGDGVPADCRLLKTSSLQVEESALTGESLPVLKDEHAKIAGDASLGDRLNMVYSGCLVSAGRGRAVVTATGMRTEMGKIAGLLGEGKKLMTPLQLRLKDLARKLTIVAILAGLIIFLIGVFVYGDSGSAVLLTAISLAVAAVPETLPVIVTLILSNGVQLMVRKKTIIRKLSAVETVGNTSIICSDKTGTLTQNQMVIQKMWLAGEEIHDVGCTLKDEEREMLYLAAACTNATAEYPDDAKSDPVIIGDPTEAAIVRLLLDIGDTKDFVEKRYPRVFELPFDSTRKRMTTVHKVEGGYISITKGAFDRLPAVCSDALKAKAVSVHDSFAGDALRVIAVAYKLMDELPQELNEATLEHDLNFLGILGMIDPPRPESRRAVRKAKEAGIRTVMITGDHVATASAIARQIGILEEDGRAVTGKELAKMSDEDLGREIEKISVYARVSPEDKIRIVKAWQAHDQVITMTGDGVNDAPALRAADVGAAMGITGTDVSKNASDIIITDDNFATIVDAVSEGRVAYDNIRKVVHFLLSVNFAEILAMLIGVVLGWGTPLTSVQLLFVNVVSDGIPGFFISKEKPEADIMKRPPLPKGASLFAAGLGRRIASKTIVFVLLTLGAFFIGRFVPIGASIPSDYKTGITMAFITLSWASVLNIFNVRTNSSIFTNGLRSNKVLTFAAIISMGITALVALIPALRTLFVLTPLGPWHWLIVIGLSLLQLLFGEIFKLLKL